MKILLFFSSILFLVACDLSTETDAYQATSTGATVTETLTAVPLATTVPTTTLTAIRTSTSIPTPTPTLSPTPRGGGSSSILLFRDFTLYSLKALDSDVQILVSQQSLIEKFSVNHVFRNHAYFSPDGQKIAIIMCASSETCLVGGHRIYLASTDLSYASTIYVASGVCGLQWAPDSRNFFIMLARIQMRSEITLTM